MVAVATPCRSFCGCPCFRGEGLATVSKSQQVDQVGSRLASTSEERLSIRRNTTKLVVRAKMAELQSSSRVVLECQSSTRVLLEGYYRSTRVILK